MFQTAESTELDSTVSETNKLKVLQGLAAIAREGVLTESAG